MIIVPVKEGENIEKALKKFKRKFKKRVRETVREGKKGEDESHLRSASAASGRAVIAIFYFMADKLLEEPVRRVRPLAVKTRNLSGRAVPKFLQTICTQS